MPLDPWQLCKQAQEWLRAAGVLAQQSFRGGFATFQKADNSLVTEVDVRCQDYIVKGIQGAYPDHHILAEEGDAQQMSESHAEDSYCWVVDPIDGSRNFARGLPFFSCAIAVVHQGATIVGAVYDPLQNDMYTAVQDHGAYLNDTRLAGRMSTLGRETVVAIPSRQSSRWPPAISDDWLANMVIRSMGSTALHLALVAGGAVDACFVDNAKVWDILAGSLIVQESEGIVTDLKGGPVPLIELDTDSRGEFTLLAAHQPLHSELLKEIV